VTPSLPDQKAPKIFFLGIDGLSLHILNDLLRERKLPHFTSLIENGCYGELETMRPTNSAVIFDLAPTILYLSGLPVARDMKGKVLKDYIQEDFINQHPVTSVKSYGKREKKIPISPSPSVDEEIKERLKALGYIDEDA